MERETATDLAILERLVSPAGKDLLDVGCGGGGLVRQLVGLGARVTGLEISETQLAPALAADDGAGASYVVGSAEALPLDAGSLDAVVFMRSLHHVPIADQLAALAEAGRVLRAGGVVHVAEPLPEGDFFELMSLVEDEREVRRAAQNALAQAARAGLESVMVVEYEVVGPVVDLDGVRGRIVSVDPDRAEAFDARRGELELAFSRLGQPVGDDGGRRFRQPMRAELLQADTPGDDH